MVTQPYQTQNGSSEDEITDCASKTTYNSLLSTSKVGTTKSTSETSVSTSSIYSSRSDDTLHMISTPWTTESWSCQTSVLFDNSCSGILTDIVTSSYNPKSSSSYGGLSLSISYSRNTKTILTKISVSSESLTIQPLKNASNVDTLSSWTIESFTSPTYSDSMKEFQKSSNNFFEFQSSNIFSETDFYPSTKESFKSSDDHIATSPSFDYENETINSIDKENTTEMDGKQELIKCFSSQSFVIELKT